MPKAQNKFTGKELSFIRKWTIEAPRGMRMSAKDLSECRELKRHTLYSIAGRIKRHKYADLTKSRRVSKGILKSKVENRKIISFIHGRGRFWPSSIVAEHLQTSYRKVQRIRVREGLPLKHEEAVVDPVYRKWYLDRERKRVERLKQSFRKVAKGRIKELRKKLEDLKAHGFLDDVPDVSCRKCRRIWPRTTNFFHTVTRISVKGARYIATSRVCRACPANGRTG